MFRVRPCTDKDLTEVFCVAEKYTSFDAKPSLGDIEGLYARNPEFFFVAHDEHKRIVGFITGYERKGVPENVLRTWNARRVGYVDLMAVDIPFRRKGVGTALLNTLLEHFSRVGIDLVLLDVPAEEEAAVRLYKEEGFETRAYNMRKYLRKGKLTVPSRISSEKGS
jgi:ribosomal protein S18 acetylase RimI-like enzyme